MRPTVPIALTFALLAAAVLAGCGGSDTVTPKGAVYSYKIPQDFQTVKVLKREIAQPGVVKFPTAVASSKTQRHQGEGITVGELPAPLTVTNTAALRASQNQIDPSFRSSIAGRTGATVGAATIKQVAGHPAIMWTATGASFGAFPQLDFKIVVVFAGPRAVEVVCRWGRTADERDAILKACDDVLASLHVTGGSSSKTGTTTGQPADPQAAAVTDVLQAAFAHPTPAQCTSAMTARYIKTMFEPLTRGERKVASTARRVCAIHQKQRAAMTPALREVTVERLTINGDTATATLRGTNGYPTEVLLTRDGAAWRLDAPGAPATGKGSKRGVAPEGSLYAYRIPPGFRSTGTRIGQVTITGSAYSTGVASPAARHESEGIGVAQTTDDLGVHDTEDLLAQLPHLREQFSPARVGGSVGRFNVTKIGGRPAVQFTVTKPTVEVEATLVFSSAPPVVVAVDCRAARREPDRQIVGRGCDALLRSLRVR